MDKKTRWPGAQYATIDLKDHRQRRRLRFFIIGGAIELLVLALIGFRGMQFMESVAFCGQICHSVMKPEATVFERSLHAKVACVQCHIGPGATWMVKSKINGIPQVFATLTNSHSRPIPTPVQSLRPARDTCEQCHWPAKFSGDVVRFAVHYQEDEANTEAHRANVFKVGGGQRGVARDIHWHIGNDVWYLPMDEKRQQIGWVGVEEPGGKLKEFVDLEKLLSISREKIESGKRLMDCVDCHNRAAHIFRSPTEIIDEALAAGTIDKTIPFIKKKGVEVLSSSPGNVQGKIANAAALETFYQTTYPEFYSRNELQVKSAILRLQEFAGVVEFPEMKVDWKTHISNMGHTDTTGCFRCHGKLVARSGARQGQAISAVCQDCHYPLSTAPGEKPVTAPGTPLVSPAPTVTPATAAAATAAPAGAAAPDSPLPATTGAKPSGPPKMPAGHAAAGCGACHSSGAGGAPMFPANHSAFAEAVCGTCHQRA
ncbi:MAG: NapC/NirT family cytochrome c [Chloroflexi bacterium]|nr:NapC/NirT family cytochrome c [Chloroflexota bacterium]